MALYEINGRMKQKRDTAANWEAKNPVILNGEIVLVDTNAGELRAKIGDGVKKYLQLPFSDEVLRNLITDKANKDDIPTALKNPNAITFTGASTGTYDGSSALTINIPTGGVDAYTQFTQVVISLPLSGWTGSSTFTNTIAVSSVKADTIVIASPAPSDKDVFAFFNIYCSAQAEGSLTFMAKIRPSTDLTANLIIVTLPEGATAAANTCSLTVAGWVSNTQTVSLTGMAADRIAIIGPIADSIDVCKTNAVYCSAQGNGTLTFKCQTTPSVAITMNVIMI